MSSCMDLPPKHAWIFTFKWSPKAIATFWVCSANYLTGDKTRTWGALIAASILWRAPRQKTAVFPVPDWLCTMTSLPDMIGMIALCWTAEGLSNPEFDQNYHSSRFLSKVLLSASLTRTLSKPEVPNWNRF